MASPARQRRPVAFLAFLAAVIMAIVVAVQFYGRQSGHSRQPLPLAGGECRRLPRVKRYVPSAWEAEWYAAGRAVTANDSAPCTMLTDNPDHVEAWLEGAAAGAEALNSGELDPQVFSTFVFEDPCLPEARITAAIEPLVGHFRHPKAPNCLGEAAPVGIQARDYLILGSELTQNDFAKVYPGRKLLFDFGTSYFSTSLKWLLDTYGKAGIQFDEMWAWEVKLFEPERYWSGVPAHVKPSLHFYDVGIVGDTSSREHPINYIKAVARPGDFVVVKLDIDNVELEMAFMKEVLEDAQLRSLISEMMFEMHYSHRDMEPWFGQPNGTYTNVLELFHALRKAGLRLHYWP